MTIIMKTRKSHCKIPIKFVRNTDMTKTNNYLFIFIDKTIVSVNQVTEHNQKISVVVFTRHITSPFGLACIML